MKKNLSAILFLIAVFTGVLFAGPIAKIADLLQQGQAHELMNQASAKIELSIMNDESVVSKAQAETQLAAFFTANKPIAAKVVHSMDANPNLLFAIISLKTSTGNFRVSYSIKTINGSQQLTELHIQLEKEP